MRPLDGRAYVVATVGVLQRARFRASQRLVRGPAQRGPAPTGQHGRLLKHFVRQLRAVAC